ncbi:unnamed protein product [Pleuronectes platessa]|uniref:MADF domain-containing protein n=1 Tax=Pleuronectes platessa TaxID=8262 RepID=A0A9N7TRQ3_PLEPL|nr:unnamed protein product [Pleuronectes platessa]
MDQIEEPWAEEVRKYDHLYNPSLTEHKDTQMACNSWKDISANVSLQVDESKKLWRKIRDKFVLQKNPDLPAVPQNAGTSLRTPPRPPTLSDAVESHCQQSAPGQGGVAA